MRRVRAHKLSALHARFEVIPHHFGTFSVESSLMLSVSSLAVLALASAPPSWRFSSGARAPRSQFRRAPAPRCQLRGAASTTADGFIPVDILTTGINSRCISASTIVSTPIADVWAILTDYDNLATHVPNLVVSNLLPHPEPGGIRLYQEGAQKIVGFDFRASLTMDMVELTEERATRPTRVGFTLVDSAMFATFDGEWSVKPYSRTRSRVDPTAFEYKTRLTYRVNITPKGPVPVPALEWRIREDVPPNLRAVKAAAERRLEERVREERIGRIRDRDTVRYRDFGDG